MPSKLEARQKARQDDIITAARRCFRQSGFHAASMSQIGAEARLSVGQIYRYFSNKNAIIGEIIRRVIDLRINEMEGKTHTHQIPYMLAWRITTTQDDDALMLEMSAEASRNPEVAALLKEAEDVMFENACDHLRKIYPHLSETRVRCCAEAIAVMFKGTIYRRQTPQQVPPEEMEKVYKEIIDMLVSES